MAKVHHRFGFPSYPAPLPIEPMIDLYGRINELTDDYTIWSDAKYKIEINKNPTSPEDLIYIWANRFLLSLQKFRIFRTGFRDGYKLGCEIAETVTDVLYNDAYMTEVFKHVKYTLIDFVGKLHIPPAPVKPAPVKPAPIKPDSKDTR